MKLYHGTDEDWCRIVRQQGVRRAYMWERFSLGPRFQGGVVPVGRGLRLNLTDSLPLAKIYAARKASINHKKRGCVLEIEVPENHLKPDEQAYWVARYNGQRVKTPRDWQTSLKQVQAVIYDSTAVIPPQNIRLVSYVRLSHPPRMRTTKLMEDAHLLNEQSE